MRFESAIFVLSLIFAFCSCNCGPGWKSTLNFCYFKLANVGYHQARAACRAKGFYIWSPTNGQKYPYFICIKRKNPGNLGRCFEENQLFVEDSLPVPMSLNQCFQSCRSTSACKFFTWNTGTQRCGLRFFKPGSLVNAPTQRTGTRNRIVSTPNKVLVGKAFRTTSRNFCQKRCQQNFKCKSVTFAGPGATNPNTCVLNYGPTVRKLGLPSNSGVSSSPKFC